jgi:Flp pilus assembly protein TadG
MTQTVSHTRGDGGSVAVEMAVLVIPMAIAMTAVAIFVTHWVGARIDMDAAAAAAARAASLTRTTAAAQDAASAAAAADLATHRRTCTPLQVSVDTTAFTPGGQVAVTVTCTITNSALSGWALPGTSTSSSTAHAVIDTWRAIPAEPERTPDQQRPDPAAGAA